MKRLFVVKDHTRKVSSEYFESKVKAKQERNRLNSLNNNKYYYVARGPDHIGPHGNHNKGWKK